MHIQAATDAHFKAGQLLSEALEMFKKDSRPAKDWIEWANTACQVRKAQAYNLVKIYNDFGEVSEFKGCSMRVLNLLVHASKEVFSKIEEEAKDLAIKGKLTTKAVNALLATAKPATIKQVSVPALPTIKDKSDPITKVMKDTIKDTASSTTNSDTASSNAASNLSPNTGSETDTENQLDKLIKQNVKLLKKISELESKLAEKAAPKKEVANTVYLPQFEANKPNLVLGIEETATASKINERYRTMAIIFNAKTCPKGAKALKAAKDAMIKALKLK